MPKSKKEIPLSVIKKRRQYLLAHDSKHGWNRKFIELTVEDCVELMKTTHCHWCGKKLRYSTKQYKKGRKKQMNPMYMTFDRVFSDIPHHAWNLVAACWKCNVRIRGNKI